MKRIPELRALSDDHHTGLVLARRCKQLREREAGRPAVDALWRDVLGAFSVHLEPHFRIEEDHLLPALEAIGEGSLARRIEEDHRDLRALRDTHPVTPELVRELGIRLEAHIRFEERDVFEVTQHRLPRAALREIERACETVGRAAAPP